MPTKGTSVKGIRLPNRVWDAIDEEASGLGMSRNEYLGRRIAASLSLGHEVQKTDKNVRNQNSLLMVKEVPDDDD